MAQTATSLEIELQPTQLAPFPSDKETNNTNSKSPFPVLSYARSSAIILPVAGVNFLNTLGSGILTVALPTIAKDLDLTQEVLLWPAAIYGLTCGCSLLISGAIADVVGRRPVFLLGSLLLASFTLGCGLARTSTEFITFRGVQGVAISFCLPSGIGIISSSFAPGQRKNIAFACIGGGSPIGYAFGLVLGGIFAESVGWRYGYYLGTACSFLFWGAAIWSLPKDAINTNGATMWTHMKGEIDWVGATLASTSLALIFYVSAVITGSAARIGDPVNIALLSIGVALLPTFVFWVGRQEKLGKPAIIPNSLWKNVAFTSVCLTVFFTWAAFNAFGYFASLYFQDVQQQPPMQTSLRFLPTVVAGILTNMVTGLLVNCGVLMALADIRWPYWYAAFPAIFLSPISSDVLYTTSMLIITSVFPHKTQSLAGGVFNTISQVGNAVGLAVGGVIAATVALLSIT
ncbi:hypothetical protein BP5796_06665 [Coleophoma crateriformis]|uniref:Major facilitator superfamily (MFS) profile domain-containing protein n=1 Tax=Coleophoma crateriformis TaxID=565419 RepID=A0A3D8RPN9_9HELO|nr:hypothetical protein BP5796_06665 [Coleophoma crateriformis]